MCISYLNSILTTYTNGAMFSVGDINETILHDSEQNHIQNFLTGSRFTQHIQVPTTDYDSPLDHMYTRDVNGIKGDVHAITVIMIKHSVQSKLYEELYHNNEIIAGNTIWHTVNVWCEHCRYII